MQESEKPILISEIFGPTIQGEGALVGTPTIFVRIGGCDFRCTWCDTPYAVLPEYSGEWQPMSAAAILQRVRELHASPLLITLSGGNPALAPLEPLLELGKGAGYTFALETQGSIARRWFAELDELVLSPKPPSSGMETRWERVEKCIAVAEKARVSLKVVVFDEADFQFAREAAQRFPDEPFFLQIGTPLRDKSSLRTQDLGADITARSEWLLGRVLEENWTNVKIIPQLHVLLWGRKRGV